MPGETFSPNGFAARVKERRLRLGMSYQDLHKEVAELTSGAKGSSYGTIYSYENNPPDEPRDNIVRALAEALKVTYEWLYWGDGPPDASTATTDAVVGTSVAIFNEKLRVTRENALVRALGFEPPGVASPVIHTALTRLGYLGCFRDEGAAATAARLGAALAGPLKAFGVDFRTTSQDELVNYLVVMSTEVTRLVDHSIRNKARMVEMSAKLEQVRTLSRRRQEDDNG